MKLIGKLTEEQMKLSEVEIRKLLQIPKNRFYSVSTLPLSLAGSVWLDESRERIIECKKLSKSP